MLRTLLLALLAILVAAPAAAQTAEERVKLRQVAERGRLLFDLDRAAWVATDDLAAKIEDLAAAGFRGYIVERESEGLLIIFYGGPAESPVAMYEARVVAAQVVSSKLLAGQERRPLTPRQRRMAEARGAIGQLDHRPCAAAPFNTVVVPPEGEENPIEVYFLTPQLKAGTYPFGGHFLARIGADGRVMSSRAFTNSCMDLPTTPEPGGKAPVGLMVTHLLDPLPTELHVFLSIWMRIPVAVGTGDRVWWVDGEAITLIDKD